MNFWKLKMKNTGIYPEKAELKEIARKHGISLCGIVNARQPVPAYERFVLSVNNVPAELAYLRRPDDKRRLLAHWDSRAVSALVCAFPYWDSSRDYSREMAAVRAGIGGACGYLCRTGRQNMQPELLARAGACISRYALLPDYHRTVKEKLRAVRDALKKINPAICGSVFCDTSPVMEKDLAEMAGLGFRGRNTLLISPQAGSWFFIGGLTLNFYIEPDSPLVNMRGCGDCRRCEQACPAGALSGGCMDQGRCHSFLTTQKKEPLEFSSPEAKAKFIYSYGCDICQLVCPYNKDR